MVLTTVFESKPFEFELKPIKDKVEITDTSVKTTHGDPSERQVSNLCRILIHV